LKPLIEKEANLEARRSEALRGDILRQIITSLARSPIVVANVTDRNPNVLWELGVRHSFKHGTITIAEKRTKLPFDLSMSGTLFYDLDDTRELRKFRKRFRTALKDCLLNPDRADSHVLETMSGRGSLYEIFHREETARRLEALLSELDWNATLLGEVRVQLGKNKANPAKLGYITQRFRLTSVELLSSNRYLEENKRFYELAENYHSNLAAFDDQLNQWEYRRRETESWMSRALGKEFDTIGLTETFRQRIVSVRDKISEVD